MYAKDPNELSQEHERRARAPLSDEAVERNAAEPLSPPGTFSLFKAGYQGSVDRSNVRMSLRVAPSMVVLYDVDANAEIFIVGPGDRLTFNPDREGE